MGNTNSPTEGRFAWAQTTKISFRAGNGLDCARRDYIVSIQCFSTLEPSRREVCDYACEVRGRLLVLANTSAAFSYCGSHSARVPFIGM